MTTIYHILRTIEIIVTMVTAIRLLTCPYEMRWKGKIAKVIFGVLWALGAALPIANGLLFNKYAGAEYVVMAGYTLIMILVFFKIPLLHAMANNLTLWVTLQNIHYVLMIISTDVMNIEYAYKYNEDFTIICPLEIIKSMLMIGILIALYQRRKPMFCMESKKAYTAIIIFNLIEWWWINYVFTPLYEEKTSERIGQLVVWLGIVTILSWVFLLAYNAYIVNRQQLKLMYLKDSMLEEQFESLKENYELKRRQVHDGIQQNLLLSGYLEQGKIEEAQKYLEELRKGLNSTRIKGETGITEIDVMLHYKRQQAEAQNTRICTKIEMYFCPLKRNDVCILLGNLLDNALEATEGLPEEQREISLHLQTVNKMFLLAIENPYQGERKIQDGKYLTTKKNSGEHGLGLESSRRIVESYGGSFQIKDDGSTFCIEAIVFNLEEKGEEENEKQSGTEGMECSGKLTAGVNGD